MQLREITDKVFSNISEAMREKPKDKCLPPVALIFKGENMGLIPTEPLAVTGPAWRDVLSQIIQAVHEQMHIDAYCVGTESYGIFHPSEELIGKLQSGEIKSLTDVEGHDEVLIITAGDNFQTITRLWKLKRDAETGLYNEFVEEQIPDGIDLTGPFNDILVVRPTHLN